MTLEEFDRNLATAYVTTFTAYVLFLHTTWKRAMRLHDVKPRGVQQLIVLPTDLYREIYDSYGS